MKKYFLVFVVLSLYGFSQGMQLTVNNFQINTISINKTKNGKIPFAVLKPVKNANDDNTFGYWISDKNNVNNAFLVIKDGNTTIATITAKDFATKARNIKSGIMTYQGGTKTSPVDISIESKIEENTMMPLSKSIVLSVKATVQKGKKVSIEMNLIADGMVTNVGTYGISNSRVEHGKAVYPVILLTANEGTSAEFEGIQNNSVGKKIRVISKSVSGNNDAELSFYVNSSTVKDYDKALQQAANIESMISSKKAQAEIALVVIADKQKPFPRDTVTYTIYYTNVGTAFAQDAVVSNSIPENMSYLEGSARGESTEIKVKRKQAVPPQIGEAESISWKIGKKIMPGEEGSVTMKAIVK